MLARLCTGCVVGLALLSVGVSAHASVPGGSPDAHLTVAPAIAIAESPALAKTLAVPSFVTGTRRLRIEAPRRVPPQAFVLSLVEPPIPERGAPSRRASSPTVLRI